MAMTPDLLKQGNRDYFLALWRDRQLEMEPHCRCGRLLDEDYQCPDCNRPCQCTFILCADEATYEVVQKFIHGNPEFKHFECARQA